jgi:hypothetical protein
MVEADSHLKLLPPSILDIYKVFEHIVRAEAILPILLKGLRLLAQLNIVIIDLNKK